jgi:hypothetical protein
MPIMNSLKDIYHFISPKFQNIFLEYKIGMKPRYGHGLPPHPLLYDIIDGNRENYAHLLMNFLKYNDALTGIRKSGEETNKTSPVYNNGFLPGLDIIGIYSMLAEFKPEKYIEVGSGNSTKVAYKSIQDNKLETVITSIDPKPRSEIDKLANEIIRLPFEEINLDIIFSLKENDILFIDNTHRILPNSDSTVFYLEVLPALKRGLIVHIHDIYLPYDYPQEMCDRAYSEQYGLAMYLLSNPEKYKTLLPNYFISEDKELSGILDPMWNHPNLKGVEHHGCSYWLKIQ